jgi:hypothetical protein
LKFSTAGDAGAAIFLCSIGTASLTLPPGQKRERRSSVVALDLMRGLAAIMVLLVHVRGSSFVEYGALPEQQKTLLVAMIRTG